MTTGMTLRQRLENSGTRTVAREELRRRILAIVEHKGETNDVAIWQASAPEYLPWELMTAEIKSLHAGNKLQLEIVAPGQWIVRSLSFVQAQTAKTKAAKPRSLSVLPPQEAAAPATKAKAVQLASKPTPMRPKARVRSPKTR